MNEHNHCSGKTFIVFADGRLAELVFRPNHNPSHAFAVWSPVKQSYFMTEKVEADDGSVVVCPQDELIGRVVMLSSGVKEYGNDTQLMKAIQAFIHRYMDVGPTYELVAAYYVLLSWVFDRFNTLPYLRVLGDYGMGKTRFLEVVGNIIYKGIFLAGVTSRAALYRLISKYQGSLIIDEGDFTRSALSRDLIKILNLGTSPTFEVILCNNSLDLESFQVFSPKIIASRQTFKDKALESRCLTKEMTTAPRECIPKVLPACFKKEAEELRNKLLLWRFRNYHKAKPNHLLEIDGVESRLNQVVIPLLSVIKNEQIKKQVAELTKTYQATLVSKRKIEKPAQILKAVLAVKGKDKELTMVNIARYYNLESKGGEEITPRKCGHVVRNVLNLPVEHDGKNYRVDWDSEKIKRLQTWYGIPTLEKQSRE